MAYPIGYVHVALAEVPTGQGRLYPLVAIDHTSRFALAGVYRQTSRVLGVRA